MLKNFTIRFRVIAAISLLLLTTIGTGVFSWLSLDTVNAQSNAVATNWLPATQAIGSLSEDFERYRLLQGVALLRSGEDREKTLAKARNTLEEIEQDLKAYDPTITPGKEEGLAKAMHAALADYIAVSAKFESSLAANNTEMAMAIYIGDMQPIVDRVRATVTADREFQVEMGNAAATGSMRKGAEAKTFIMVAIGLAVLLGGAIGGLMITGISNPVRKMTDAMRTLANGVTTAKIPNIGERNEIGDMASAVEVFKDNMIRNLALEEETRQAREDAEIQRRKTMYELADQFESAVGGIVEMVSSAATEMQATASQLTSSAQESAAQATSVSAAAEEAGTNVTSVASSAEELGASVSEIGRQVEHSSVMAREAVREADSTAAIVQELSEAADRINGIVDMIAGIASQTNLLALNATIESARAGEAGKGFAVVAAEVKQLAQQTGKATSEISQHIGSIQSTTKRAVEAIENITGTIRDINDSSSTIAAAVEQQGAATSEIVQAVNQASLGTQEVTSNITGVARMAEETGAGAAQVLSASGELALQAENLRTQINNFLAHIRAA
ncbi:methyl-accepting chemotaxis protein [Asticcacaulis taihuensis]|uniref:Methyl-accepting chemotaxis protein n=1 Tax=Asticcacaulis taihuensis TaxID=260084 RepID=A0A1G4T3J7_9CAUL|nr:methyl-accepting chemotaxis protein [Asticcacaulis taihuensis]SCW75881.1 methyl-accepting chemotaxis protein [Asticcacaulis taihuensis]